MFPLRARNLESVYTARLRFGILQAIHLSPGSLFALVLSDVIPALALPELPVLGLDVVGKGLGLDEAVVVVVGVVVLGPNVLHLVDITALGAALNRALAGHLRTGMECVSGLSAGLAWWRGVVTTDREPDDVVGVGRETSAASVLLRARGADHDGVFERAWRQSAQTFLPAGYPAALTLA